MPTYAQIKSPLRKSVAHYVRQVMRDEELTQQQLSDQLQVSAKTIGTWSLGLSQPSVVSTIQRAANGTEYQRKFYLGMLRAISDQITSSLIMLETREL